MLKFKRKESILKRFHRRINRKYIAQLPRHSRKPYWCRDIMYIKAMRLDIRIKCHSCRENLSYLRYLGMETSGSHLDIKGYIPCGDICAECKNYMRGGTRIY